MSSTANYKRPPWSIRDLIWVLLAIICLLLAANSALVLLDAGTFFKNSAHQSLISLGLFFMQELLFFIPFYFKILRPYKVTFSDIGLSKFPLKNTILWTLKGFGLFVLVNIFYFYLVSIFGHLPGFGDQESHIPLFGESTLDIIIAIVVLVGIAPVLEEIFFRGFILQTLLAKLPVTWASIITAVIFSLMHLEFQSSGIIFVLALILNWLFIRTRSLWPSIGFHMLNNSLAFIVEWVIYKS